MTPLEMLARKSADGTPLTPAEMQLAVRSLLQDWMERKSGVPSQALHEEITKDVSSPVQIGSVDSEAEEIAPEYVVELTKEEE